MLQNMFHKLREYREWKQYVSEEERERNKKASK